MSEERIPLISFITTVYNEEKTVLSTIKSVISQAFDDYEYIIIDDGSTDETPKLLDKIAATNEKITIVHQNNQWVYPSFNNGIRLAKGEYIFIINADDVLEPNVLPQISKILREYAPDVLYALYMTHLCDDQHEIIERDIFSQSKKNPKDNVYCENEREFNNFIPHLLNEGFVYAQTSFYKRSIASSVLFRERYCIADEFFNIDILSEISKAYVLYSPIYNHYKYTNGKNISQKYYPEIHNENNELFYALKRIMEDKYLLSSDNERALALIRMKGLTNEYKRLNAENCPMTINEKLRYIFEKSIDACILEAANLLGDREQLDARVLSQVKTLLLDNNISIEDGMYFVYDMLDSLLCYEKDEEDYKKIELGVYNERNPARIGECFLDKLKRKG